MQHKTEVKSIKQENFMQFFTS